MEAFHRTGDSAAAGQAPGLIPETGQDGKALSAAHAAAGESPVHGHYQPGNEADFLQKSKQREQEQHRRQDDGQGPAKREQESLQEEMGKPFPEKPLRPK